MVGKLGKRRYNDPRWQGSDTAWYIYRLYASDGDLLYVGMTCHPLMRLGEHRATKPWYPKVAYAQFEHYGFNRSSAYFAEKRIIGSEQPRYNRHPGGRLVRLALGAARAEAQPAHGTATGASHETH